MAGRSTWQVAFGLEIQIKDPKPCLKQNLRGKLTDEQPEVGHSPCTSLFGSLLHQELTSDTACSQMQQTPLLGAKVSSRMGG